MDAVISHRLMLVLQEYGILPEGRYGFIEGGAPEWRADLVSGIQWHSRREQMASCQAILNATSAYDPINNNGAVQHAMCLQCLLMSKQELCHILAHTLEWLIQPVASGIWIRGHDLKWGLTQGAPVTPLLYILKTAAAEAYANNVVHG